MAVRRFDPVTDPSELLWHTVGTALDDMQYGCIAAIVKFSTVNNDERTWFGLHEDLNEGGFNRCQMYNQEARVTWHTEEGFSQAVFNPEIGTAGEIVDDIWYFISLRKDNGTGAVWLSMYDYDADEWYHEDTGNFGNFLAAGTDGQIEMAYEDITSTKFNGLIAARGAWNNNTAFALSSSGNDDLEAAGLHTSLQAWVDAGVTSLWRYNQSSVTDPVDDLVGDAHQIDRVDTAVVNGDDPPGFNFELGSDSFTGTITAVEGDDTASLVGTVNNPGVQGTITAVEGDDTGAISATFDPPVFTGTITAVEGDDTASLVGAFTGADFVGTISATEGDDTAAIAGSVDNSGAAVDITFTVGPTRVGSFAVNATRVGSFAVGETVTQRGP